MKSIKKQNQNSLLVPTLRIVNNSNKPLEIMKRFVFYILKQARTHKFKTIVILLGLYAAKKTYGIYNTFADTFRQLSGGEKVDADVKSENASEKALSDYLVFNQSHLLQLNIFQKT